MTDVRKVGELYSGDSYVVYRGCETAQDRTVVVKTLARGREDVASAARLRHEYELLTGLDVPGVVRPLRLQDVNGVPELVLEPAGTLDLGARLRLGPLGVREFLDLATRMAAAVGRVHARNVVHRDLSPAKFVLDDAGGVTLVGFEFATALSGRISTGELEGTLAYLAPEQTGWLRRAVDHRADLYALGATFYEMLVGSPPFSALAPAELVHAHLASRPVSPTVRNPSIPILLSHLVLKLLAKMPEERYQSAEGLTADLEEARRQWQDTGAVEPFLLGREDLARELPIPGRLFGRESESATLASALQAAARGERRCVCIRGTAGVGKTALVETLAHAAEAGGGRYIAGKCDQLSHVPMAPFTQALGHGIAGLLALPPNTRAAWRQRVATVFEGRGRLVTELLPELGSLVGEQPPVEELDPKETENRIYQLLSALVRVLAEDGPLVLFLDDVQWADANTLKLLRHLSADATIAHLLIVVACREERADAVLGATLAAMREAGSTVAILELAPLDRNAVTALLVETLRSTPAAVADIARAVHDKTGGNPLFVRRLLRSLWQAKLLYYDRRAESYAWNRARIAALPVTDNVADLLIASMQRLPEATRQLLEYAACIGMRFDVRELAAITGYRPEDAGQALWSALHEGFLVPVDDAPRNATESQAGSVSALPNAMYAFAHDRIREAAYALLDGPERRRRHLRIGRALLEQPAAAIERRIFDVVDQLNRGAADMSEAERQRLAELNLLAGRRARATAAYAAALEYLGRGLVVLRPDAPAASHALWFDLHRDAAESAFLIGDHVRCRALAEGALAKAATDLERAELANFRMLAVAAQGNYREAVASTREALRDFGIEVPEHDLEAEVEREFDRMEAALAGRRPMDLLDLPTVTDSRTLAPLRLLADTMSSAYTLGYRTFIWFALRSMRYCLERGSSRYMPRACADFAVVLVMRGQHARAHEFGRLATELCARIGNRTEESKVLFIVAGTVNPWHEPVLSSVQPLRLAAARAFETGELQYAGLAATFIVHFLFYKGTRLDSVLAEIEQCQVLLHKVAHRLADDLLLPHRQALRALRGHIGAAPQFDDEEFQEAPFLARAAPVMIFYYATLRMQVAYLMGDLDLALEMSRLAERHQSAATNAVQQADFSFYTALTSAAVAERRSPEERAALLGRIGECHQTLARWAESCSANFGHKRDLVAAERARLEGDTLAAERLHESAIDGARREGYLQDEALARERYGRFCLAHGLMLGASMHLGSAIEGYSAWGAAVKARALEAECAALGIALDMRHRAERTAARVPTPVGLELGGLLEAAATLTAELVLPQLLEKLVHLALELSGAERGVLVVSDASGSRVRVSGTAVDVALEETPLAASEELPQSIAEHVLRTGNPVVLGDAMNEGGFGADPYVRKHRLKSVLAVPLRRTARSSGVLYLENNLATLAFTPERVQSLELLSGQIGAALDNAELVRQLEDKAGQARLLADVSAALAESLDYDTTLNQAVRLAVPALADMCMIDLVEGKAVESVATAHVDPSKAGLLREFRRRYPVDWNGHQPAAVVLRSGRTWVLPEITAETCLQLARDSEQARLAGLLNARSAIATPLIARGRTLGVMVLASTRAFRYREHDLLVQEFVHRVALALDNARSYRQTEEAVRARDDFLSIASHELRTPVAALELTVEGLNKGLLPATPEMLRRTTVLIERQVGRLAQLIEQLLSVSRIQAGRVELQVESVDLAAAVRNVVESQRDVIAASGSRVSVHSPGPVVGRWDMSVLEQVASNLLTNALKFGQHNPIDISVEQVDQRGRLCVRDHGTGIPPERLPHVFERFERAVSAREFGGLGLGLFIARSIVNALGGTIRAESRLGEGSSFIVELPLAGPNQGRER